MDANTTMQEPERRRRIRRNVLLLAAFALLVYVGFIVTFVYSRS
jgi:flagellar basal body-associated protein FliL